MHTELIVRPNSVVEFKTVGSAVAISGSVAIVAPIGLRTSGQSVRLQCGRVRPTAAGMLTKSESSGFDNFGAAVAIVGDYAAVGRTGRLKAAMQSQSQKPVMAPTAACTNFWVSFAR